MDLKHVKSVIELLESSEVDEIEVSTDTVKIRVARHPHRIQPIGSLLNQSAEYVDIQAGHQSSQTVPRHQPQTADGANKSVLNETNSTFNQVGSEQPNISDASLIKSPVVGTFYQAASPESQPFVQVGTEIKKGDILCVVEAMKMMNQIESDRDGVVKEILVENGEAIEFDQPLFSIQ